jgi:GNAT superfamily N-acetyltransferase
MNLSFQPVTDPTAPAYLFAERTLQTLFPREEYRDLPVWRDYVSHRSEFHLLVAYDEARPVGLLSYWDFGTFRYVEHFGVAPEWQGRGYGSQLLQRFIQCFVQGFNQGAALPVVLEGELPTSTQARRRIAFYERQGFRLWPHVYAQPPYRRGDAPVPMSLMGYGWEDESQFEKVRDTIYQAVYGVRAADLL